MRKIDHVTCNGLLLGCSCLGPNVAVLGSETKVSSPRRRSYNNFQIYFVLVGLCLLLPPPVINRGGEQTTTLTMPHLAQRCAGFILHPPPPPPATPHPLTPAHVVMKGSPRKGSFVLIMTSSRSSPIMLLPSDRTTFQVD